jgi:hypothetical protein
MSWALPRITSSWDNVGKIGRIAGWRYKYLNKYSYIYFLMVHMTLNIPKDLHDRMKRYPEIKWSEVARRSIAEYLVEIADSIDGGELAKLLKAETLEAIKSLDKEEIGEMYREAVRLEWERMKSLTRAC